MGFESGSYTDSPRDMTSTKAREWISDTCIVCKLVSYLDRALAAEQIESNRAGAPGPIDGLELYQPPQFADGRALQMAGHGTSTGLWPESIITKLAMA